MLASDGQKMSKRKKNYPDPLVVVNSYGADALRLYLINSPGNHPQIILAALTEVVGYVRLSSLYKLIKSS